MPDHQGPDRRPGLPAGAARRHRRHRAERRRHPPRRSSTSTRASWSAASSSPTPARRATPARTTGRSPSAISTATARSSTASNGSATRPRRCALRSSKGDWDEVGYQIAKEWENRKRLAPGVTTSAIDELIERAAAAGATAAKVCGAGGGGCLFCYGPPTARSAIAEALGARRGAAARLPHRDGRPAAWITPPSRASSGRSPICWRSRTTTRSRSAPTATAPTSSSNHPHEMAALDVTGLREIPGIGKDLAARIREIVETGDAEFHRELDRRVSADDSRSAQPAGCRSEDRRDALSRARHPHDRRPREGGRGRQGSARCAGWARRRRR